MVVKAKQVYQELESIAKHQPVIGLLLYKKEKPLALVITDKKLDFNNPVFNIDLEVLTLEEFLVKVLEKDKQLLTTIKQGLIVYDNEGLLTSVSELVRKGLIPGFKGEELNIYNQTLLKFQEIKRLKEDALIATYSATMDVLGALMYFLGERIVIPKKADDLFKKHLVTEGIIGKEYYKKFKYIYKLLKDFEKGKKKVIGIELDNALEYAFDIHEQVEMIIKKKLYIG